MTRPVADHAKSWGIPVDHDGGRSIKTRMKGLKLELRHLLSLGRDNRPAEVRDIPSSSCGPHVPTARPKIPRQV